MALTFDNFKAKPPEKGGWRSGYVDITLDGSYATGGWAITAANLKLNTIYQITPPSAGIASARGFLLRWDHATGKLSAFQGSTASNAGLKEIDAGDLNGEVIRCFYEGW